MATNRSENVKCREAAELTFVSKWKLSFPSTGKKILQSEISLENFSVKKYREIWASGSTSACRLHLKFERIIKNWMICMVASRSYMFEIQLIFTPAVDLLWHFCGSEAMSTNHMKLTKPKTGLFPLVPRVILLKWVSNIFLFHCFNTKGKSCFASAKHRCQYSGCCLAWN